MSTSEVRNFRVGIPQAVTIQTPLNGSILPASTPPAFDFNTNCNVKFKLEVSSLSDFGSSSMVKSFNFTSKDPNIETTLHKSLIVQPVVFGQKAGGDRNGILSHQGMGRAEQGNGLGGEVVHGRMTVLNLWKGEGMGLLSAARGMKGGTFAFALCTCVRSCLYKSLAACKLWAAAAHDATADSNGADFSQSEMRCLTTGVRELGTLDYEIILRNTGSERPENVQLWNSVDTPGVMLASAPGLSYDVEHRLLHWHGTMDPGEERRFTVSLVTLPGSAGTMVSNGASIVWGEWVSGQGSFYNTQRKDLQCGPVEVRSRERDFAILFTVGRIGLGWLEVVIVGYLLFAPLFVITVPRLVRRREKQRFERSPDVSWHDDRFGQLMVSALSVFFVACIPFVLFFASMFAEDVRRFVSYERTTCTLLDKKIGHSVGSTGRMKSSIFGPLVSVRIRCARKRDCVGRSAGRKRVDLEEIRLRGETARQIRIGEIVPVLVRP